MRHTDSTAKSSTAGALPLDSARAIPTFIATDLLEKLILDRDALAARRVASEARHN